MVNARATSGATTLTTSTTTSAMATTISADININQTTTSTVSAPTNITSVTTPPTTSTSVPCDLDINATVKTVKNSRRKSSKSFTYRRRTASGSIKDSISHQPSRNTKRDSNSSLSTASVRTPIPKSKASRRSRNSLASSKRDSRDSKSTVNHNHSKLINVSHKLPPMPPTPSKGAGSRKSSDHTPYGLHRPVVPIVPFPDIQRPQRSEDAHGQSGRRKRYSTNLVEIERNHGMHKSPSQNHGRQRSSPVILVSPSTISRSPSISTHALRAGKAYRREQDVYLCRPPSPSPTVTQRRGTFESSQTKSGNMESSSNTITFADPTRVYYTMPQVSGTRNRNQSNHLLVMERCVLMHRP